VTGALLTAAAALLVWPAPARAGARLSAAPGPRRPDLLRRLARSPWAAASVAGAGAAVLSTALVAVLAAGCAALAARALERRRRSVAVDARLLGLAEALGVLAAELRAGRPLADAAAEATAACPDPGVRRELALALRAPAAGVRAGPDLLGIAAAVELSLRTGCSLAAVAAALEDDLRARHRHWLELRTATSGPRASAVVLAGLPVLGLAMGAGIGAHPWRVLTTTGAGQVLLVAGVLLELAGVAWIGRLTRRAVPEPAAGGRYG
jgi:tight adherence protein B